MRAYCGGHVAMSASQFVYLVCERTVRNYIKFDVVTEHYGRLASPPASYSSCVPFISRPGDPLFWNGLRTYLIHLVRKLIYVYCYKWLTFLVVLFSPTRKRMWWHIKLDHHSFFPYFSIHCSLIFHKLFATECRKTSGKSISIHFSEV
jgi:hypothetical protein